MDMVILEFTGLSGARKAPRAVEGYCINRGGRHFIAGAVNN
jgi:hypothetical protein